MNRGVLFLLILFTVLAVSSSTKHYFMTACAGNTCRSPMAAEMIKSLVPDPDLVSSFGVNVRSQGAPMAPWTEKIALDLCYNRSYNSRDSQECITRVRKHQSKPFDLAIVNNILQEPGNSLRIIPMDDETANAVKDLLQQSKLNHNQLSRITVGVDIVENGAWSNISANAPDPFFAKNTYFESAAYRNTSKILSNFVENTVLKKTPVKAVRWLQNGEALNSYAQKEFLFLS